MAMFTLRLHPLFCISCHLLYCIFDVVNLHLSFVCLLVIDVYCSVLFENWQYVLHHVSSLFFCLFPAFSFVLSLLHFHSLSLSFSLSDRFSLTLLTWLSVTPLAFSVAPLPHQSLSFPFFPPPTNLTAFLVDVSLPLSSLFAVSLGQNWFSTSF